jgi:hypothetical protein
MESMELYVRDREELEQDSAIADVITWQNGTHISSCRTTYTGQIAGHPDNRFFRVN